MPIVKNKRKLCETSLSDFSIEQIDGVPFYNRYMEMERLFRKLVPSVDFGQCFAQPVENKVKRIIEWYYYPGNEMPFRLSDLLDSDVDMYNHATSKRNSIITAIDSALKSAGENERMFLNAALTGIGLSESDSTTYLHDDCILFGVWGMKAKQGRKIEDVIREDVLDHRVFTINYTMEGLGNLSFSSVGRKYGYRLTPNDVPQVVPAEGWIFAKWEPDIPQGWTVVSDASFTAICEHGDPVSVPNDPTEPIEDPGFSAEVPIASEEPIIGTQEPNPVYNVHFRYEDGGSLYGKTEYIKNKGEKITSDEVPQPIPDKEYIFVGWNHEPVAHEVIADTTFTARFRKIEEDERRNNISRTRLYGVSGCLHAVLNWLLLLSGLLLLFLLLWCFLFDKCHFNLCGCGCDNQPVTNPVVNPQPGPNPVQNPCNTEQASGGEEGYSGFFDMGQQSGKFVFEYNTINQPDRIVIYDGKGTNGQQIFTYEGGTSDWAVDEIEFHNRIVTVTVEGLESGTAWEFKINCPNK